jgi:rhamnogalacturonan hydrolase
VEVTNGDECVTVKNTASNFLVENVHCNQSGGCSIGSLALDTSITLIHYNHIYENNAGGHYIKSYGGSGTVSDSLFENFIVHNSGYTLTNNEYWDSANNAGGPGVFVTGLTYRVSTK